MTTSSPKTAGLRAMLAAQEHRQPNRRLGTVEMIDGSAALVTHVGDESLWDQRDSTATAVEITRRAAVHHGTTPAQVAAFLRDEEKRVRGGRP